MTTVFVFIRKTDQSKSVKQEVNGLVTLPPLVFPGTTLNDHGNFNPTISTVKILDTG
jgi:hypothetical protein